MMSVDNLRLREMLRCLLVYRGFGFFVFVVVLSVLAAWVNVGSHTTLSAVVYIGKHQEGGRLETNGDIERFLNNSVLSSGAALTGFCDSTAVFLDGPVVKINCRGPSGKIVMDDLSIISDAIISRHERLYHAYDKVAAHKRALSESRIAARQKWIGEFMNMLKDGREDAALIKSRIFEYQDDIQRISSSLEMEDFSSQDNHMTSIKQVKVVTREFDAFAWLLIVMVSIFSGLISMLIVSIGRLEADRLPAQENLSDS